MSELLNLDGQPGGWETLREATETAPAVEARFLPPAPWMKRRAGELAARERTEEERDLDTNDMNPVRLMDIGDVFTRELLRLAIVEFRGVGDAAGEPVDVTPPLEVRKRTYADEDRPTGTIDQFLAIPDIFDRADELYIMPQAEKSRPKNGSAASPNGTGEAGTQGRTIATSPAATAEADAATSAPTSSASPPATPRKGSGKSSGTANGRSAPPTAEPSPSTTAPS